MIARSLLISLLALASVVIVEGTTFVPRTSAITKLRGGAGPLDATNVAKIGTAITGSYASTFVLSPSKACEMFGAPPSPKLFALVERMGAAFLALVVQTYCLVFQGTSLNTAVGASAIPWIVLMTKTLLNDEPKELGFPAGGQVLCGVTALLVAYACLTNSSYADIAIKLYAIWGVANAVFLVLAPAPAGKMWGFEGGPIITFTCRYIGWALLAAGVYTIALLQDVEGLKALGYAYIPALVGRFLSLFVTKEVEETGMSMGPMYFLLLQEAILVGTLAI